jgi:hypothetical protein
VGDPVVPAGQRHVPGDLLGVPQGQVPGGVLASFPFVRMGLISDQRPQMLPISVSSRPCVTNTGLVPEQALTAPRRACRRQIAQKG